MRRREQLLELGQLRRAGGTRRSRRRRCRARRSSRSRRAPVRAEQPVRVVQEAEVAAQSDRRRRSRSPARHRSPSTRIRRCRWRRGSRAPASPSRGAMHHSSARTGRLDATTSVAPSGSAGRDVTRDLALARRVARHGVEHTVDRRPRQLLGVAASRPATRSSRRRWRRARRRRRASSGSASTANRSRGRVVRVEPGAVGVDEHLPDRRVEPRGRDLARERRTDAHDEVGAVRVGEAGRAQQRLVRRDRERSGAQLRDRIGEHRPAGRRGEPGRGRGRDAGAPSGDQQTARMRAHEVGERCDVGRARRARRGRRDRPRPPAGATGRVDQRRARRQQRLAERQVEVHRPGAAARASRRPRGSRARATSRPRPVRRRAVRDRRTSAPRRRRGASGRSSGPRPVSRSSGGRSAVHTSSGTRACDASTTAGWKFAAAVPEVHNTTAGRPLARPSPSARNAAERSSSTTCTRSRSSRARASASGADREPGATTASVTPARAHSSTSVAANDAVASRPVTGAPPRAQECGRGPTARRSRSRLHPDRELVGAHGRGRARVVRCPRARRAARRRTFAATARAIGVAGGRRDLRRLLDGRPALPAARARPARPRAGAHAREHVARHRRPGRARGAGRGRRAARRQRRARRCATRSSTDWLAQPMFATRSARRARPHRPPPAHTGVPRRVPAPPRRGRDGADVERRARSSRCRSCS